MSQIRQVLMNLIANAADAIGEDEGQAGQRLAAQLGSGGVTAGGVTRLASRSPMAVLSLVAALSPA